MNFEDTIRKYFNKKADDLLKDFPDEDPDMNKMSIEELRQYAQR